MAEAGEDAGEGVTALNARQRARKLRVLGRAGSGHVDGQGVEARRTTGCGAVVDPRDVVRSAVRTVPRRREAVGELVEQRVGLAVDRQSLAGARRAGEGEA